MDDQTYNSLAAAIEARFRDRVSAKLLDGSPTWGSATAVELGAAVRGRELAVDALETLRAFLEEKQISPSPLAGERAGVRGATEHDGPKAIERRAVEPMSVVADRVAEAARTNRSDQGATRSAAVQRRIETLKEALRRHGPLRWGEIEEAAGIDSDLLQHVLSKPDFIKQPDGRYALTNDSAPNDSTAEGAEIAEEAA